MKCYIRGSLIAKSIVLLSLCKATECINLRTEESFGVSIGPCFELRRTYDAL
jgi:hypothetical protein